MKKVYPKTLYLCFIFCFGCISNEPPPSEQPEAADEQTLKIMGIFAHPDDETLAAPVLAKYAEDHEVYVVIATDGRYGATAHAGIPAGDSLALKRAEEVTCSCQKLGALPPILLGLPDGLGTFDGKKGLKGFGHYMRNLDHLKEKLDKTLADIQPDIIITFGPDGITGHPDHRMVGTVTTEVLTEKPRSKPWRLYYMGMPATLTDHFEGWGIRNTDIEQLDVQIPYGPEEEKKYREAFDCHKTQFTEKQANDWFKGVEKDTSNVFYLRAFKQKSEIRRTL